MDTNKAGLQKMVLDFVKKDEGYNKTRKQKLKVHCDDKNTWGVIYGENLMEGIAGYGETPELSFADFVRSWKQLKGFEWIANKKGK